MELEIRAAADSEHGAGSQLYRFAWLPRTTLARCEPACGNDLPGVPLPRGLSRRRLLLSNGRGVGEQSRVEYDALVFRGHQLVSRLEGRCEPPVRPRAAVPRRLYIFEVAR